MINYKVSPKLTNTELTELFADSWGKPVNSDHVHELSSQTVWVAAYDQEKLIGFVKVVSDGGKHGFVLDTTTHSSYQSRGVGTELLKRVSEASKAQGIQWLHVDFEAQHTEFYRRAGFRHTEAGVLNLDSISLEV